MGSCRELEPLLAAYVDGEMAQDQRARVQAHLADCPPCRHAVAGERAVREVLQARRTELVALAPPRLRKRCEACVCGSSGPLTSRFTRRAWIPLSFAATMVLAVGAVFVMGLNGSVEALATQLALDHVKCFQFAPTHAEIDSAMAGAAWKARNGWLINVPSSAPVEHLELIGVRRCRSTQGVSAHIMYRWRGKPLSVYVLDSVPRSDVHVERLVSRLGQEAVVWVDAGRTYAVVGRGPPGDLQHIAHYMFRR